MKKIEAFIKPFKLAEVREALHKAGFGEVNVMEIRESGSQKHQELFRGTGFEMDFFPRGVLIVIAEDHLALRAVELIRRSAATGHTDDGKIIVSPVDQIHEV